MRKLGILIGIIAVATLGLVGVYGGTASASNCSDNTPVAETFHGFAEEAEAMGDPGIFSNAFTGVAEGCEQDSVIPVLCGVTRSIDAGAGAAGQDATPLTNEMRAGINELGAAGLPAAGGSCDTTPPPPPPPPGNGEGNGNGGGGGAGAEVQAANAAADGGLPRTGGELFAGVGFGLASLGALIRRFLA